MQVLGPKFSHLADYVRGNNAEDSDEEEEEDGRDEKKYQDEGEV